jgi:hypothetical protein
MTQTNFQQSVLTKLSLAIVAAGGSVPVPSQTNFEQYVLELLDELNVSIAGIGGGAGESIVELSYTVSQSSIFGFPPLTANTGTYAKLTDDSDITGAGTQNGASEWIQIDLGAVKNVLSVTLGAGTLPDGFGAVASYLNDRRFEISDDGSTWELLFIVSGMVDTLGGWPSGKPVPRTFPLNRRFRYARLSYGGWIGVTEMRFRGY